jgi:hypothetical protein
MILFIRICLMAVQYKNNRWFKKGRQKINKNKKIISRVYTGLKISN